MLFPSIYFLCIDILNIFCIVWICGGSCKAELYITMKRFIKTNSGLYNQNVKLISAHNNFFLQKYFLKWCCGGVVEPMNIRVSITFRC